MKKIKLLLFLPFLLLANDEELFKRADLLEQEGKYKEALEIYKEINKKNKNIKVEDSFTTLRQECPLIYWWDELLFFTSNSLLVAFR